MAKKSRLVRGETGAVFEVDAAMVDEPRVIDGPFRASSGPLPASAIKPASPARSWKWILTVLAVVLALAAGAFLSSVTPTRAERARSTDPVGLPD